jgi:hypothetical protein
MWMLKISRWFENLVSMSRIAEPKSTKQFRRLKGDHAGQALIAAMRALPHREIDLEPERAPMPVRDISDYQEARVPVSNPWVDPLPD